MARWFIHEPNTAPMAPHNCACGSCGNGLPVSSSTRCLERADELLPVVGVEIGVERVAVAVLVLVEDFLEVMVRRCRAPRRNTW